MLLLIVLLLITVSWGGEYVIKFRDETKISLSEDLRIKKRFKNYVLVEVSENYSGILRNLSLDPQVEYVVPNVKLRAFRVPDDPLYDNQWGLKLIGAERAWDRSVDCSSVSVAVIDTGVDYDHEDLHRNMWRNERECNGTQGVDDDGNGYVDDCVGWDFVNGDADPDDDNGHGTMSAGIIGAGGNNGVGVAGVCWRVSIMPLKILDSQGVGDSLGFFEAVYYAVDNGAKVINTSLGTCPVGSEVCSVTNKNDPSLIPLKEAIEYALSKGVILVAASGNEGVNTDLYPVYPASFSNDYPNVISVTSMDQDGSLSWFSNYGVLTVDIAAPGGVDSFGRGIVSTYPSNLYSQWVGTSFSAPFVAGAVAHLLHLNPNTPPGTVKEVLLKTAVRVEALGDKVKSEGHLSLEGVVDFSSDPGGSGGGCSTGTLGGYTYLVLFILLLRRFFLPKLP